MQDEAAPPPHGGREPQAGVDHIGEVVEASTTALVAQASQLNCAPAFGSYVEVRSERRIFGIVFNASTQSIEPNRRPTAYGKTEEQLRLEQPQIFELLRTHFQVLVIGYVEGGKAVHTLPPQPARIHSFVHACDDDAVREFTADGEYLRSILDAPGLPTDDLIIASLRHALNARGRSDYLERMGKDLARLLCNDYNRLTSLIRRLSSSLGQQA